MRLGTREVGSGFGACLAVCREGWSQWGNEVGPTQLSVPALKYVREDDDADDYIAEPSANGAHQEAMPVHTPNK
jgi:hypothetical protein